MNFHFCRAGTVSYTHLIPAEYKCENLFKLDLKATSILGEQSAFEGCSENQSEVFEKWLDENASEYLTEDEMKDLKEKINAMRCV